MRVMARGGSRFELPDLAVATGKAAGNGPAAGWCSMNAPTMKGKIYFMGVFAGDAELLSAEAVRVLRAAEIVLHDAEVSQAVLDLTPPWTQVRNVGGSDAGPGLSREKIHALLIGASREGHQVVRVKCGVLPVTESAADELEALEQAGVEFEVIAGTASSIGAAAGASAHSR